MESDGVPSWEHFENIGVLPFSKSVNGVAGRQGVSRFGFHPFAAVRDLSLTLSDFASSATMVFSSAFFRLLTFADFAGAMSLKMSLAAGVSSDLLRRITRRSSFLNLRR
jgi:hypothetical protein